MFAIRTEHLNYRPGRGFALRDVGMEVPKGSVYGFLGPNGSGKTTTIKLTLGLLRASGGTITLLGEPVPARAHRALARIGYVPEAPHLYASLRVEQSIAYHAGFYPTWDAAEADRLRQHFGLRAGQRIGSLSKGEMRKLMVLLALAQRPELLVLDEPTDGLDPVIRRELLDVLAESTTSRHTTVLISSHLVHELEEVCDWIAVIDDGRIAVQLPMTAFRDRISIIKWSVAPDPTSALPFTYLRERASDEWVVEGWKPDMADTVRRLGGVVAEVQSVDLELAFVETLKSVRTRVAS